MKDCYLKGFPATCLLGKDQVKSMSPNLAGIPDAPDRLYVTTKSDPMKIFAERPVIAIVGTRNSSPYGEHFVCELIREIARNKSKKNCPVIVSGLSLGIDIIAHQAALTYGLPTVAVMGTGPDTIYPHQHLNVAKKIASAPGCALITSYAPETAPLSMNFLMRNHILTGLADTTVLVESGTHGSGIVAARLAASYGRKVYAVPGRVNDKRSEGCNALIENGVAKILISANPLL